MLSGSRFGFRYAPNTNPVFGETAKTDAFGAILGDRLLELPNNPGPLSIIPPQFGFNRRGRRVRIPCNSHNLTNFLLPMLSLLRMPLHVIEHHLFALVQTHIGTLQRIA